MRCRGSSSRSSSWSAILPETDSRGDAAPLPLAGLTVVAVEQYGAGPFGTMHLADMGAEVIKVEPPGGALPGDSARHTGPQTLGENDSLFFQAFNRNKRSLALDLRGGQGGEGREVFRRLVARADAVLDNMRGDQPARLGLTYADLAEVNPRIVCVHISGYGRAGERATWPAYDYLIQAEAGFMALTGEPDAPPTRMGLSVVDYTTGVTAALALVSAVLGARATGRGRDVEVSLFDTAMQQLSYPAAWWLNGGIGTPRRPRSGHPAIVPCERFRAPDGDLFVMCIIPKFWDAFAREIGRADLLDDERFRSFRGRLDNRDALAAEIDRALGEATVVEWMGRLAGKVPVGPVRSLPEALENPFVAERGGVQTVPHPSAPDMRLVASPIRPDGALLPARAGPALGADTDAILGELGYEAAEIERLRRDGGGAVKLEGVRVLDLALFLPGPHLTMTMADHGADVTKVEPPGEGKPVREAGYRAGGTSVWFRNTHRGKRSVQLDLKTEAGREGALALADKADVFVEAFRPGVVDRLGIGYDVVAARNPRVVYASVAAFGQTGPLRDVPAHDIAIEAHAGVVSLNLGRDGRPTNPHMPVADLAGSLMALSGIFMALLRREQTGRGDYIDLSMMDATMAWLPNVTGPVFAEGRAPVVKHERSFGGNAFFHVYDTADGRSVVLGGVEPKFVRNLLGALGREDLIPVATAGPGPHQDPVRAFLSETFATRSRDEWVEWFRRRDVCFAPVLDLHEAFHAPQVAAREMLVRDGEGNLHIGIPIKFRDEPGRLDPRLPGLGEHTEEALREAGCDEALIAAVTGARGPSAPRG